MQALKAQGVSRDTLPYKAPFQPYAAWVGFGITGVVTFFKGQSCLFFSSSLIF
jgi:amino acid transporter